MIKTVILSMFLPILAGGGLVALCWLLPPLRKWKWLSGVAFGFGLAVGGFASFVAENGVPPFPPTERKQWIGLAAVLAAVFAVLGSLTGSAGKERSWPSTEFFAVLAGVVVTCLPFITHWAGGDLQPYFSGSGPADQIAMGLAVTVGFLALDRIVDTRTGATLPLVFFITFAGLAPIADAASWITLTFLFAVAAGISLIAAVAARFGGSPSIGRGGLLAAVILLVFLPAAGYRQTYGDFPWWAWGMAAAAPLILLPLEHPWLAKLPPWGGLTLRLVLVAAIVGTAVVVVLQAGAGADAANDYGGFN